MKYIFSSQSKMNLDSRRPMKLYFCLQVLRSRKPQLQGGMLRRLYGVDWTTWQGLMQNVRMMAMRCWPFGSLIYTSFSPDSTSNISFWRIADKFYFVFVSSKFNLNSSNNNLSFIQSSFITSQRIVLIYLQIQSHSK